MPWTKNDYPNSLKNLSEPVRDKAIEIANSLIEKQDYSESKAIAIATTQAKQWADRRDIDITDSDSSSDDDDEGPSPAKAPEIHVVTTEKGWGIRSGEANQASRRFETQSEAISAARERAKSDNTDIVIHGPDGKIRDRISLRRLNDGPSYHVSAREDEWIVIAEDADRASRVFDDKDEAVAAGREIASRQDGTLIIHAKDDSVQKIHEYSSKPARR